MTIRPWVPALLILAAIPHFLAATPLLVSAAGTYDSGTPVTFFTAPDATWSLSFEVDITPFIGFSSAGVVFSPAVTFFNYSLNGVPLGMTPSQITFWSVPADTSSMLSLGICWEGFCGEEIDYGLAFDADQLYTGPESSPTIVRGVYPTSGFTVEDGPNTYGEPNTTLTITDAPPTNAPEPSGLLLGVIGLVGLAVFAHVRYRQQHGRSQPGSTQPQP